MQNFQQKSQIINKKAMFSTTKNARKGQKTKNARKSQIIPETSKMPNFQKLPDFQKNSILKKPNFQHQKIAQI